VFVPLAMGVPAGVDVRVVIDEIGPLESKLPFPSSMPRFNRWRVANSVRATWGR